MRAEESQVGHLGAGQRHAELGRRILPILARQAPTGHPLEYGQLARELDYRSPLALRYPLGAIGNSLIGLEREWGRAVPPIQRLVVSKKTGLPGSGFNQFVPDQRAFRRASKQQRKRMLERVLWDIIDFPEWGRVLEHFDLQTAMRPQGNWSRVQRGGGGEGPLHLAMKKAVAAHPEWVSCSRRASAETEADLPSGDSIDVLFDLPKDRLAVEVKTSQASEADIERGLYQCVKYEAVLVAVESTVPTYRGCEAVLALGGELPSSLVALAHTLGVRVVEWVGGSVF